VLAPLVPKLGLDSQALTFSATLGGLLQTRSFRVQNAGGGNLDFRIAISGSGAAGLVVDSPAGSAQPTASASVVLTLDPRALPTGTFQAALTVTSSTTGETLSIPITIIIGPRTQRMAVSQRGLLFTAVLGGGVTPPQSFAVLNSGEGAFLWRAAASTFPGASGWLSVTPDDGLSDGQVIVRADPRAIVAPGVYYGLVRVSTEGASNSPRDALG